jgi:hypothetical protein
MLIQWPPPPGLVHPFWTPGLGFRGACCCGVPARSTTTTLALEGHVQSRRQHLRIVALAHFVVVAELQRRTS